MSDLEDSITEKSDIDHSACTSPHTLRRGAYNVGVNCMYNTFHIDDENDYGIEDKDIDSEDGATRSVKINSHTRRHFNSAAGNLKDFDTISWATTSYDTTTLRSYKSAAASSTKQSILQQHKTLVF